MKVKEHILKLDELRYVHIKDNADDVNIDIYADEILKLLRENFLQLDFDFVMEQLSRLGHAPNLLYDDNGHWAVTCTGFQNAVYGEAPDNIETHFYVDAEEWKNTPVEALEYYLTSDEE